MNIAIIGRSELLFQAAVYLRNSGHVPKLVVTSKEAPEYRYTAEDFKTFAAESGCVFMYTPNVKAADIADVVKKEQIQLAVSINYTGVLAASIIDLFPLGVLNAHGGDLPRYRGNACQAWAIINGEEKIGLCIHKMIGGELDSGDIIGRAYFDVNRDTRIAEVYTFFEEQIPGLMLAAISDLEKNPHFVLERQSKNIADALRCYPRMPEDGLIDWKKNNLDILRLINASSEPYAGAFTSLNGKKLTIWRAEIIDDQENYLAVPGQVATIDKSTGFVTIIAGNGKLILKEVECDGVRATPATFISSIRTRLK
jgi:methionyl-tRNA formyltransferase